MVQKSLLHKLGAGTKLTKLMFQKKFLCSHINLKFLLVKKFFSDTWVQSKTAFTYEHLNKIGNLKALVKLIKIVSKHSLAKNNVKGDSTECFGTIHSH